MSGVVILAVDWIAFGIDVPTGFALVALVSAAAFVATFLVVFRIQRRAGDSPERSCAKAFLGAFAAGVPFPITGTVVGAAILAMSGLPRIGSRR